MRALHWGLMWLLLLSVWSPASARAQAVREVTVSLDDNYPPYIYRDTSGAVHGYLVDVWALWSEKTGVKVRLLPTHWAQAQADLSKAARTFWTPCSAPRRVCGAWSFRRRMRIWRCRFLCTVTSEGSAARPG